MHAARPLAPSMAAPHLPKLDTKPIFRAQLAAEISVVDDILRSRAEEPEEAPLIAYPRNAASLTDFEHFTAQDLHRFADAGAKHFIASGLPAVQNTVQNSPVVALLAASSFEYLITVFSLSRLGYTVLFLSNRLALGAYAALLQATECSIIVHSPQLSKTVQQLRETRPLSVLFVLTRDEFTAKSATPAIPARPNRSSSMSQIAFIIHSSGSTGLPKPIYQTHSACVNNYSVGFGRRAFTTLPLYHNFGLANTYRSIFKNQEMFFYNPAIPQTGKSLAEVVEYVKPGVICAVPYTLKLLGESQRGIEALKACEIVFSGGSACPDELGERLVEQDVNLVVQFGATEVGQVMSSARPAGDKAWDYLRIPPAAKPFIAMEPLGADTYECVVLNGWKSKVMSNSDDPPNSFRTRDTFMPHPTIPDAWKHVGRLDDRITLMNGEKVLPLPMEGRIRGHEMVKECMVFGIGKAVAGLLVFPSINAQHLGTEQLVELIWPAIQEANMEADSMSRISRGMIVIIHSDYPQTDKGTFIRARVYTEFANEIEQAYNVQGATQEGSLALSVDQLEEYLLGIFADFEVHLEGTTSAFFTAGVDSLMAITIWGLLKKQLDLGGNSVKAGQNIIYEKENVFGLARYLFALRTGTEDEGPGASVDNELQAMEELVRQYSTFKTHSPSPGHTYPETHSVVLTGATGSLGAFILADLLNQPSVSRIWCLVRAKDDLAAASRVSDSLMQRQLLESPEMLTRKAVCFAANLADNELGLPPSILATICSSTTLTIHAAWAVNFILPVRSFGPDLAGLQNLLSLSLSSPLPTPPRFLFCSSISSVMNIPPPASVQEEQIMHLSYAQNMGYGRSKLVAEQIVHAASKCGANARGLRIGQIVGDTKFGIWNENEAVPMMIRSALTIGALPMLKESVRWMPVDVVARVVLELSGLMGGITPEGLLKTNDGATDTELVYNVLNPGCFGWTNEVLPALKTAGLKFEMVETAEWLDRLRRSEQDPVKNPPVKLLGFWEDKYRDVVDGRPAVTFITDRTVEASTGMREIPGLDVRKYITAWRMGCRN